jgi:ABC-2 type transport system permease protein
VFFLFGRALSSFAMASVSLMIMVPVLMLLFNIRFDLPLAGVVIIVITLIGVAGFGLMIAGMTIVFKQTGPVANMMSNMMLFINGTFLPVDQMPKWLESLAMILPSTQGIIALREVSLNSKTLTELWSDGTLVYLTAHSSICLIVGWMIFVWCERVARRQGSLGQY